MSRNEATANDAVYTLFDLISSHRITAAIYVAAKLGLADLLASGAKTAAELAHGAQANEAAVERLMRALVTLGICRIDDARFVLTEVGAHLAASSPRSLQSWALFEGEMLQPSWSGLIESVRTGKTRAELAGAASSFDLVSQDPIAIATFNAAMADIARLLTPAVAAYDFSAHTMLIDVGGGTGELLAAILRSYPNLRGAVFDLARCADAARRRVQDAN